MNSSRILNNEYGLAEMQENLLQALDTIDEICRKNSIYYAIHGGTMLGAERNGHLIPWDDDVDISMKRTEFEKLKRVINKGDIPDNYYLDEQTMWFPRFVMKKKEAPVYIDILIWDYITENKLGRFLKINLLRAIQGMMKEEVDYSRFDIKGKVLLFITQSVGKLMSNNKNFSFFILSRQSCFLDISSTSIVQTIPIKGFLTYLIKTIWTATRKLSWRGRSILSTVDIVNFL